jgi:hypothetical protein
MIQITSNVRDTHFTIFTLLIFIYEYELERIQDNYRKSIITFIIIYSARILLADEVESELSIKLPLDCITVGNWGKSENRFSSSLRAFNSSADKDFSFEPKILLKGGTRMSVCCCYNSRRYTAWVNKLNIHTNTYSSISSSSRFSKPGPK